MASGQVSPKRGKVVDIPANAPTIGTATDLATNGNVSVAFTAASTTTGGPIFKYRATSNPGSITADGTSSPITVSGLTNDTAYTFTVAGVNATGVGPSSAASNSATPTVPPTAYESIASFTGTGSTNTVTFSGISSTYKHLQIRIVARDNAGGNAVGSVKLRFNGDTSTSYYSHYMYGAGSTPSASSQGSGTEIPMFFMTQGSATTSNFMAAGIIDINDSSNTNKYKLVKGFGGADDNATVYSVVGISSGNWLNTSAINSITITSGNNNNWNTQSIISLYGIKG